MMILVPLLISAMLAFIAGPLVIAFYKKKKWLDDPSTQSHPKIVHTYPVPRGGGIVVAVAILLSIVAFLPLSNQMMGIMVGTVILLLVGIWDDVANPPPLLRLLFQTFAALCVVWGGTLIPFITNPFGGILQLTDWMLVVSPGVTVPIIAIVFSILWMLWCMNSVNFSTGLDGQMPGYVVISALTIAALSQRFILDPSQEQVFTLAMIVAGSFVGFLFWNVYPQKMMSGFGASTIAGFYLAVLSMLSGAKLATAILVLAVPMADAVFVIVRRLIKKKSPFYGDRSHFHHALLDAGLSKPQVAIVYWSSAAVLGIIALRLNSGQKLFAILLVGSVVCMIAIWLRSLFQQFGRSGRVSG
ncbi:undecaprenyl/decaprenyl-phosphate alpha-N-acetylglucosaminyl 1-phosphate transferase [Candidatus Woesebacteria bacterium]|nr:undecaprenyl/decaprenyl-phosphate alpha-N-acetylglucosaminyl 1-phosphate transferase [Candidatus Woesebacteria bacterium]